MPGMREANIIIFQWLCMPLGAFYMFISTTNLCWDCFLTFGVRAFVNTLRENLGILWKMIDAIVTIPEAGSIFDVMVDTIEVVTCAMVYSGVKMTQPVLMVPFIVYEFILFGYKVIVYNTINLGWNILKLVYIALLLVYIKVLFNRGELFPYRINNITKWLPKKQPKPPIVPLTAL